MGKSASTSQTKSASLPSYGRGTDQTIEQSGYSDAAHNYNVGDHQFLDDDVTPQIEQNIKQTTKKHKFGQYHLFLEHKSGEIRGCSDIIAAYRLAYAKERCAVEKIKYPDDMIYVAEGCWDNTLGTRGGIVAHGYQDPMVKVMHRTYWYECFSSSGEDDSGNWFKDDALSDQVHPDEIALLTYAHADLHPPSLALASARSDEYGEDYNVYDDIYSGYRQQWQDNQDIMVYNNHPYDEYVSDRHYNYNAVFILSLLSVFMWFCVLIAFIACIGCIGGFIMCAVSNKLRDDGDKGVHDSNIV